MRLRTGTLATAGAVAAALLACPLLGGCGGGEKHRSSVHFHAEGVRMAMQRVADEMARNPRDYYGMAVATDQLSRALSGLPQRIQKAATTRVEERKAKAEEAIQLFGKLKPVLEGLKFDEAQVKAQLEQMDNLIDELEKE